MMNLKGISFSAAMCWCACVFCILLTVPSIADAADYKVQSYDPAKGLTVGASHLFMISITTLENCSAEYYPNEPALSASLRTVNLSS